MPDDDKSLRKELLEARKTLTRQIEILRSPVTMVPYVPSANFQPDNRQLIAELQAELTQINEALAGLDASDGQRS